jgi:ribosomal protein S27AE
MTEEIHCGKCGFMLYFGETINERLYMGGLDEEKVLQRYNNACPNCGNKLNMKTVKIEIKKW